MRIPILKNFYIIFGITSFILGFVGIFLPILPTTPFILLSAFFFEKASPRFHALLLSHKTFGPMIKDWQQHRRIKRKAKVFAVSFMTLSFYFPASNPNISLEIKIAIGLTMAIVASYVVTRNET